jgi:hypothetical protein
MKEPKDIDGINMRLLHSDDVVVKAQVTRIFGKLTRDGKPVTGARVSAWYLRRESEAVNCRMQRGRIIPEGGFLCQFNVSSDGTYSLGGLESAQYHLLVQEPGRGSWLSQRVAVLKSDRELEMNLEITAGGSIDGKVEGIPAELAGQVWVVAFNDNVFSCETRVQKDGVFSFKNLPPGDYGLKAGHDNYFEKPDMGEKESWTTPADPWKKAVKVTVEGGKPAGNIVIRFPETEHGK